MESGVVSRWRVNGKATDGPLPDLDEEGSLRGSLGVLQATARRPMARAFAAGGIAKEDPIEDGWLLVVPDDEEGRDIAARLTPLVEHRIGARRRAGGARPEDAIRYYPSGEASPRALSRWVKEEIVFRGSLDVGDDAPFFVLVAGPPAKIPFTFEHLVSSGSACAGRIAFPEIGSYGDYARKVIAWEPEDDAARTARTGLPVAVFATDHGPTDVTHQSRTWLADGLVERLALKHPSHPRLVREGKAASRAALSFMLRGGDPALRGPRLLFSATHGLAVSTKEAPRRADRVSRQGAICCQREGVVLDARALGKGPLLAGGVWTMFACFGAGTPGSSDFFSALGDPRLLGYYDGEPFVASLPASLLARSDGPLAVLGHLDPGFVGTFASPLDVRGQRRNKLHEVIENLLLGHRVGPAMSPLSDAANHFRTALLMLAGAVERLTGVSVEAPPAEIGRRLVNASKGDPDARALGLELVDATVSMIDYQNFIVLGDPAVKLPRAGASPKGL